MPHSIMRKKDHFHHPERVMVGALMNGRHLEPKALSLAYNWRMGMFRQLKGRPILELSFKERHLLRDLQHEFGKEKVA